MNYPSQTAEKIKKTNSILEQDAHGLPLASIEKMNGAADMKEADPAAYMEILAKQLWDEVSSHANFAELTRFRHMTKRLCRFCNPSVYPGYVRFVASLKEELKDFVLFKNTITKLMHIKKDYDIYLSVLAYVLATGQDTRPHIKNLFEANKAAASKYMANRYATRDCVKYNICTDFFRYYQMAFTLCLAAKTDKPLMKQIRAIFRAALPDVDQFVTGLGGYLQEGLFADGFFGPFLFVFRSMFVNNENIDYILMLIISIYELTQYHGYAAHDTEPMFIAGLYFAINSSGNSLASTGANIIVSRCKDAVRGIGGVRMDNDFASFLEISAYILNWEARYVDISTPDVIGWLRTIPQKKLKSILEDFVVSKAYRLNVDIYNCKNYTELAEQAIRRVIIAFNISYQDWSVDILGLESYGIKFDESLIGTDEESDITADDLDRFLNLFIAQARFEMNLEAEKGMAVPAAVPVQEDENLALRQKYAELEKECRELRGRENNNKALKTENAELKKKVMELDRLAKQYAGEKEKDKKELTGLRNIVYELSSSMEQPVVRDKCISMDKMGEYLNGVKGAVIGGHVNLHNKLDKYIPKWKKYSPGTKITPNALKNIDIAVVFSDYLSHSSYFGAIDCIKESGCKLLYVHNVNLEYVLSKIYHACREGQI